eukprot:GAHX01002652.1.p1 GENE.GAHX01002652.1~~GAHX01002652.1.p1  ORF type:complete len:272 (+),score=32.47 GAHX01002652.1:47-817(+)
MFTNTSFPPGLNGQQRSLYDNFIKTGSLPPLPRHYDVIAELNSTLLGKIELSQLRLNTSTLLLGSTCTVSTLTRNMGIPTSIVDFNPHHKGDKANFTYTPPNTTINIQKIMTVLSSITDQDLFLWESEFRNTATACCWDETTSNHVLQSVTTNELHGIYKGKETTAEKLAAVFQYKYNQNSALKLQTELAGLKQYKIPTACIYMASISELVRQLAIIHGWTDVEKSRKIEETFYNGLTRRTQLEMSKMNITEIADM